MQHRRPARFRGSINRHGRKLKKMAARKLGFRKTAAVISKPAGFLPRSHYANRQQISED